MNKEIVSFNTGEMTPETDALANIEKYASGCRHLENFLPRIYGSAERRPGTKLAGVSGVELKYAIFSPPYNALTFFSENGAIWGIPLDFNDYSTLTLDIDGVARDVGGGIVGLPCTGQPFVSEQVIRIVGSANYSGLQTLTAGTTTNELQFVDTYNAETFDGTETVVQYIALTAGRGMMAQDDDGNMYFGTVATGGSGSCITKMSLDGITYNAAFFLPTDAGDGATYTDKGWRQDSVAFGVRVSTNSEYLYVYTGDLAIAGRLYKFDLSDGSEIWQVKTGGSLGYNIDIDTDDNVYACNQGYTPDTWYNVAKFSAANGTKTKLTYMGAPKIGYASGSASVYDVHVNNDMSYTSGKTGVVITGGRQYCGVASDESVLYNLAIRDLDDTDGAQIALGGTWITGGTIDTTYIVGTGFITTYNNYIYVLCNKIVYKLDTDLDIIVQIDGPDYANGIFADLWGRIVIANYEAGEDDRFYFYDTDLNLITNTEHDYYITMLSNWTGYSWLRGNVAFPTPVKVTG